MIRRIRVTPEQIKNVVFYTGMIISGVLFLIALFM